MTKSRPFCIALLLLTASSALSQDIRYNFDDTANFSKFRTYKWVNLKSAPIDEITDEQIKAALNAAFARKGLTKVDGDSATDLLIRYQTTEHINETFAEFDPGWSTGPGWYVAGWHVPGVGSTTTQETSGIYKGELAVDMYDAAKHELVWRGVASKTLDPKAKPQKRQKNLDKAIAELMKNYPPPPK
jgi:hypothetical protein